MCVCVCLGGVGGGGGERDWEREAEARGCKIVGEWVCMCTRVWMQGRGSDRVRYVMPY